MIGLLNKEHSASLALNREPYLFAQIQYAIWFQVENKDIFINYMRNKSHKSRQQHKINTYWFFIIIFFLCFKYDNLLQVPATFPRLFGSYGNCHSLRHHCHRSLYYPVYEKMCPKCSVLFLSTIIERVRKTISYVSFANLSTKQFSWTHYKSIEVSTYLNVTNRYKITNVKNNIPKLESTTLTYLKTSGNKLF